MSGKYALIIANTEYLDSSLAQLTAPSKDAEDLVRILQDQKICAFDDVKVLLNQPEAVAREAIDEFFDQKKTDDLLILYFSGHGIRDELGSLYLAVKNTNRARLRATAIKSDFIREVMDQSHSKRQVLILDCCNSGAFAQGTKAATGTSVGTSTAFAGGYGRVILTASDSTQFAWEGNKVIGGTENSLFTHFLVQGLKGIADLNGDGQITVDELYDYAFEQVKLLTPKQTPSKFSTKQQGEIVLRHKIPVEDIKPISLPDELVDEIEDTRPYVREAVVQKLERILKGKNIGLAHSAKEALERIANDDNTSRRVAQMALSILEEARRSDSRAAEITQQEIPKKEFFKKVDPVPNGSQKTGQEPLARPPISLEPKTTPRKAGNSKKLQPALIAGLIGILLVFCCIVGLIISNNLMTPQAPLHTPTNPTTLRSPNSAVATSTNAATVRLTQTPIVKMTAAAVASTGTANAFAQARDKFVLAFHNTELIYGPKNSSLYHNPYDTNVRTDDAGVSLTDFVVSATFLNPYSAMTNPWDYGFLLRNEGSNRQLRLIISSEKTWSLRNFTGNTDNVIIQEGELSNLNITENGSNVIGVYCLGDRGFLYVNGDFIADLDLSARTAAGDISIATGMFTGDEVNGATTNYNNFVIRSIPTATVFGPEGGSLKHDSDNSIEYKSATVDVKDFIAKVKFLNPYPITTGSWDYGIGFRDEGKDKEYRLIIRSDLKWELNNRVGNGDTITVAEGQIPNLDISESGSNTILLHCYDDQGILYVNGSRITTLDLSAHINSGNVFVATGFLTDSEIAGYSTHYEYFTVWRIP